MNIKIQILLLCLTCLLTSCLYGPRNADIKDRYKVQKNIVLNQNLKNTTQQNTLNGKNLEQYKLNNQNRAYTNNPNNRNMANQNQTLPNQRNISTRNSRQADDRGFFVKVGDMAPNFTFKTTDGKIAKLSDYRGHPVMLQFTASWCAVCLKEMPFIEKEIWQPNEKKGLKILAIDKDEPLVKAKQLIAKTGITYPVALDPKAEIFGKYADKKAGVTRNVIIDKNGRIVYLTRLFERNEFNTMKAKIRSIL